MKLPRCIHIYKITRTLNEIKGSWSLNGGYFSLKISFFPFFPAGPFYIQWIIMIITMGQKLCIFFSPLFNYRQSNREKKQFFFLFFLLLNFLFCIYTSESGEKNRCIIKRYSWELITYRERAANIISGRDMFYPVNTLLTGEVAQSRIINSESEALISYDYTVKYYTAFVFRLIYSFCKEEWKKKKKKIIWISLAFLGEQ